MFATPMVLVFNEFSDELSNFELFVDIVFTVEIFVNFFRLGEGETLSKLNEIRWNYVYFLFWFDCCAALPGLVNKIGSYENYNVNFTKLARFVHWDRFFK